MSEVDFTQLMCAHRFRREEAQGRYVCRCGIEITDKALEAIDTKTFRSLTTWMAYHADYDPKN